MRRKVLTVYLAALFVFFAGLWTGTQITSKPVQAQTSTYLSATPISSTLTTTQIWMSQPFCVRAWWGPTLCSEAKGDELHVGAGYKLDFLPAWIALEGRDAQGRWTLHSIAKVNNQSPGVQFVPVTGPTLVTILSQVTPSPVLTPPFPVTVTLLPTGTAASPTPTATPLPPPSRAPGRIPTLSPAQSHGFRVVCDDTGSDYALDIWGYYDLVYRVPSEWCAPSYTGLQRLLERMASATPSRIKVWP